MHCGLTRFARIQRTSRYDYWIELKKKIVNVFQAFQGTKEDYILKHVPDSVLTDLKSSCALDSSLNISNHFAFLPHKYIVTEMGCQIRTMEVRTNEKVKLSTYLNQKTKIDFSFPQDCIGIAKNFYPEVAEFLSVYIE